MLRKIDSNVRMHSFKLFANTIFYHENQYWQTGVSNKIFTIRWCWLFDSIFCCCYFAGITHTFEWIHFQILNCLCYSFSKHQFNISSLMSMKSELTRYMYEVWTICLCTMNWMDIFDSSAIYSINIYTSELCYVEKVIFLLASDECIYVIQ